MDTQNMVLFQYKDPFPCISIPIIKMRLSEDRIIFIMGIPLLVRPLLYVGTSPSFHRISQCYFANCRILGQDKLLASQVIFFNFYFLNILYFFKYSCTNIFHRCSLYTLYMYHTVRLVTIAIDDRSHHIEGKLETDISLPYLSCQSHVNAERKDTCLIVCTIPETNNGS